MRIPFSPMKITPPSRLEHDVVRQHVGTRRIEAAVGPATASPAACLPRARELVVHRRRHREGHRTAAVPRRRRSRRSVRIGGNRRRAPRRRRRFDARRMRETERPERVIDQVRAHVAECAGTEFDPAAPVERVVDRVIRECPRRLAEIQIPPQAVRQRIPNPSPSASVRFTRL